MTDVYIGRQAIYDHRLEVFGYELLYRSGDSNHASFQDADHATSVVMSNTFLEIGLDRLVGERFAFVNLTRSFLTGHYPIPQRPDQLILEILEDITIDQELVDAVLNLSKVGFKLALDDVINPQVVEKLLPIAHIVKVDLMNCDRTLLPEQVAYYKQFSNLKLLAEKIETQNELDFCRSLGFDYFQGYFLCKPRVIREKKLVGTRMAIMQVIAALQKPNVEFNQVEELIRQDVAMSYKLLRLINSAYYSTRSEIKSIKQALTLLGLNQIRAWVGLLLLSESENKPNELMKTAMIRAKMSEHLAEELRLPKPEVHFIVGLFSVLDALMDMDIEDILAQLPLAQDVKLALLEGQGELGEVLRWVIAYELGEWGSLSDYPLGSESLRECYLDAVTWADEMALVAAGVA